MTDVIDTLEITGGLALASVDAAAVREAASNAGLSSDRLRAASFRVGQAVRALETLAWTPGAEPSWRDQPQGGPPFCDAGSAGRYRMIADDASVLASRMVACADETALLRDRLLRAAGLYEQGESAVEKLIGGLVWTGLAEATFLGSVVIPWPWKAIGETLVASTVPLAAAYFDGMEGRQPVATTPAAAARDADADARDEGGGTSGVGRLLVTGLGPVSDEAVAGIGYGLALANPIASRFDFSVTGAARTLSDLVHTMLPRTTARVHEVQPAGLAAPGDSAPTGTIVSAFTKIQGLYGRGPDGEPLDVPPATVAVERVTHDDGTTAWVVLIPGTQPIVSAVNPFDGISDIDIMAHGTAETAMAVEAALDAAGAAPDEPVALIGHSLGGITAVALAASPSFRQKHRVGGVVTAGAPTASFTLPPDVPVLHVENDEELVSNTDGRSGRENPSGPLRVTLTRSLAASSDPLDQRAAGSIGTSHGLLVHQRTVTAGIESGNVQIQGVVEPIEALMSGTSAQTQYYAAERVIDREPAPEPAPRPGPAPVPALPPAPPLTPPALPLTPPALPLTPPALPLTPPALPLTPLGQALGNLPVVGRAIEDVPGLGGPLRNLTVAPVSAAAPSSGQGG